MYVLYYASMLQCWHLIWILVQTDHPCLGVRCHSVQVVGAAWRAAMRIVAGVGDLMQRTRNGRTGQILGDWPIERSGGVVCSLHCARGDEELGFLVEPQNQGRLFVSGLASEPLERFVSSLASKPQGRFVSGLASKPLGRFSTVWPQNRW
jgi:hypothetical protein